MMPGSKLPLFPYNRGWETQPNNRGFSSEEKSQVCTSRECIFRALRLRLVRTAWGSKQRLWVPIWVTSEVCSQCVLKTLKGSNDIFSEEAIDVKPSIVF